MSYLLPSKDPFLDGSKDVRVISLITLDFPDFLSLPKKRYVGDILTNIDFSKNSEDRDSLHTPIDMEHAQKMVG